MVLASTAVSAPSRITIPTVRKTIPLHFSEITPSQRAKSTQPSSPSLLPRLPHPPQAPSLCDFSSHLHSSEPTPLLLPSLVGVKQNNPYQWPAMYQWGGQTPDGTASLQGLREVPRLEEHIVEVEVGKRGRGYLDSDANGWQKIRMPFGIFLDAFILRKIPSSEPDIIGYVAQQDLLSDIPTLAEACPQLPHTSAGPRGDREQWRRNVWIGPEGTFTPIHRDPYENLFVQVIGRKRVHLFPPSSGPHLSLAHSSTGQSNTSTIPSEEFLLSAPDSREKTMRFPLLTQAITARGAAHVVLGPGDGLYIPKGWFHCIKSLDTSVSVNSWWR